MTLSAAKRYGVAHYIAGALPNTPDNMLRWLEHPQQIHPLTAMPDLGVEEDDTYGMAAYLYRLK